jgi:hypothetical protein
MNTYFVKWLYHDTDNQLREVRKEILAPNKKDAKITAKRMAEQNNWRLLDVLTGGY